jgi:hypothetical protein
VKQKPSFYVVPDRNGKLERVKNAASQKERVEMFDISPTVVAVAIPIIFILGAIAVTITALILDAGRKDREHKERLLSMEKGLELPEKPMKTRPPRYLAIRAWGFVFAFIGIALLIGISAEAGIRHGAWGFLPLGIGAALLISANMEKKDLS